MKYIKHTYTSLEGEGEDFTVTAPEGVRVPARLARRVEKDKDPLIFVLAGSEEVED